MPVKTTIPYSEGLFSITFTCTQWLPLIVMVQGYDIVYQWFDHLKSKGHLISGYVIMPNHVHVMIGFRNKGQLINSIIGNGKRFMAYEIIKQLQAQRNERVLKLLTDSVEPGRKKNRKQHNVWELSFDWKKCESEKFIVQKLDYYHRNPCSGKWSLCANPVEYEHSSARYYETGEQGHYPVIGYRELFHIDLTK